MVCRASTNGLRSNISHVRKCEPRRILNIVGTCYQYSTGTSCTCTSRIERPPSRLVGKTTCKAELAKYKEQLLRLFQASDIPERAETLYQRAKDGAFTNQDALSLNELDNEVTRYCLQVEKDTCSAKPSFPWSPDMHTASLVIKYWTLKYRNRKRNYNISEQLSQIYDQLTEKQQKAIDTTTASTRYNLHKAKIDKQVLQLKAVTKRREARLVRIDQEAEYRNTEPSFEAQRLAMIDETHHLFRYLEKLYGKKRSIGISGIDVPFRDKQGNFTDDPKQAETWIKIHDPDEIVRRLIDRNIQHFGQAQGTAFTVSPLANIYGFHGTGQFAEDLIVSSTIPKELQESISLGADHILRKLADGNCLPDINDDISIDSFWKGFQTWDEYTSTSPSGRHLGHYKALLMADGQDHLYKPDENGKAPKTNPSRVIQQVYFHIALAATLSGNTLHRWCNSSTMIIEKIPGQPRINKLRVIHIFEADFNLMLKLLWSRRLGWHAHKNNSINEAQAGSRPDHRCIDVVIRKTMNYTYAALTRTPLITIDNDAKACYDRIPCNLAMLVSRYFGMPQAACTFLANTLHQMKFKIRTAAGDSNKWYCHTQDTPIHGTGQGSCASPCIWLLLSSVLMDCHSKLANGMTQHDVVPNSAIRKTAVEGFVDDVSLFINPDYLSEQLLPWLEEIEKLISTAEADLDIWNMFLDTSGGKLELDKCFWYLLCWYFNRKGDPIPLSREQILEMFDRRISVEDREVKRSVTLELKDINEAHRTLGAYKSIVENEDKQYDVLLEKSNHLAQVTKTGQLSRFQARRAFSSIYIPSMTYSLVSTNLSQSALRTIQSKAIQAFLPAMGFERTFPHAVVFASRQMGGLNLGDLYTECGIAKTSTILEHIRANTGLGRIIQINLNWLQLHAGISAPVLETDIDVARYIPNNWFLHLKTFLSAAGKSTIRLPMQWCPQVERERDCLLMDRIANLKVPKRIIRTCNNWRLYFRALTLSDITTPDGRSIQDRYWKASQAVQDDSQVPRNSRLGWPIQPCPDRKTFSAWKRCINLAFNLRNRQSLPVPLGDWTTEPNASANDWEFYLNPYTTRLYRNRFDGTYEEHRLDQQQPNRHSSILKFETIPEDQVTELPSCSFPVAITEEYNNFRVKQSQCTCRWAFPPCSKPPADFEEHLATLPTWKQQLLMHWESVPIHQLLKFFNTSNEILVATDGGFDLEKGTGSFGAVVADATTIHAKVFGSAPGTPDLHCSFRSEMYGLLAACSLLNEITTFHHLTGTHNSTQIIFFLDSQSTIDRVSSHRYNPIPLKAMTSADMDVELQILQEFNELEAKGYKIPYLHHVKAHQDKKKQYCELSREAQLNVEADRLASKFPMTDYVRQDYHPPSATKASLYIASVAITSKYKECLRDAIHRPALKEYIRNKWDWTESIFDNIWWKAHGSALKRLSHSDCQKIQKFNYNHLPTNRRLSKFHVHITHNCPCCNTDEESDNHIIWCNHGDRQPAKQLWETDVFHFLSDYHTPPSVRTAIMLGFHHWIYNKPIPPILQYLPTASTDLQAAYNDQTKIGWDHFIRGRFSTLWQHHIIRHLQSHPAAPEEAASDKRNKKKKKNIIRTSNDWASRLIISIWHGVLILWDLRNREIHGAKGSCQSSADKFRLLQEAKNILELSENYKEHFEIEWFQKPLEELEKYSVISLKAWVRNARMMVKLHRLEIRKTTIELKTDKGNLVDANSVDLLGEMEEMDISGS